MKKICIAITKGVWGGAQEYVYTLATNLPKDKFEVFVLCGEGNELKTKLEKVGIKTISLDSMSRDISIFGEIESFLGMIKILLKEKPDILHLNSSKMGFLGALAGRLCGIKRIIFTVHGWAFNEKRFSFLNRKIYYFIQWITVLMSHKTISVSEKTKRDASKMLLANKKIVVIKNGISNINFLSKIESREKLKNLVRLSENTEIIIGTIAELHKNKGLELIIETGINIPWNASVYIIGEGEEKDKLKEMIDDYGLSKKIFLTGKIDGAKKYLKAFDIFVLPSRTEALPYSILEAGLAECAVIATKVGGIPEIIDNNQNGILIHRNIDELSNSINKLINDDIERMRLGKNLHNKIEKEFSVNQMIEKTILTYIK